MSTSRDFRVDIIVEEPSPPAPSRAGKLIFIGRPATPGDLEIRTISQEGDISSFIDSIDLEEIYWTGMPFIFCPITDSSDLQSQIDLVVNRGRTFLFCEYATTQARLLVVEIGSGSKIYTSSNSTPWDDAELVALANSKNSCLFIDIEKEGKPFYTFINNISTFPNIGRFVGLKNNDFTSTFKEVGLKNILRDNSFSFYFQPTETPNTECYDVYIGGKQAQIFYEYIAVEESVANIIYSFVTTSSRAYTDDSLAILDSQISKELNSLVSQNVIEGFSIKTPTITSQTISNKTKGQIIGYEIEFNELYRIAEIKITIRGVL